VSEPVRLPPPVDARGGGGPARRRSRRQGPRRRPLAAAGDEAAARGAGRPCRPRQHRGAARHLRRRGGDHRRDDDLQPTRRLGRAARAAAGGGRGGRRRGRSPGPLPRHPRRLARPQRPRGGLHGPDARARRRRHRGRVAGRADHPRRRVLPRHPDHRPRARRDPDRCPDPGPGRPGRDGLPEARAPGLGLRGGRHRGRARAWRRRHLPVGPGGGHRLRPDRHPRRGGRSGAGRPGAHARDHRRRGPGGARRPRDHRRPLRLRRVPKPPRDRGRPARARAGGGPRPGL
ncbi:MAG: Aerobic carbon monoxide dehydrogenase (quinone), medium chain, partial [uncultured Thermomicrobiales bacterium]